MSRILLAACVFPCLPVRAGAGEGLGLEDARRLARERNPDLKAARASLEAASAQLKEAGELQNPLLAYSVARINRGSQGSGTDQGNGYFQRSYDSIVSLSQFLETAGKRRLRQESAAAGKRAAEAQARDVYRLLDQSVSLAYAAAVESREEASILRSSAENLTRVETIARQRLRTGDISSSDTDQIVLAASRLRVAADSAQASAVSATIALEILMGEKSPEGVTVLRDSLAVLTQPLASPPAKNGVGRRPDIVAAEENLHRAELDLTRTKRSVVPDLTLSVQFEHNPPGADSLGLGFSLPLPVWNLNRGEIHAARAQREQALAQLEKTATQAQADLASARSAYEVARRTVVSFEQDLVPAADRIRSSVEYAAGKGGSSLVELLQAERDWNDLHIEAARARSGLAEAAYSLQAAVRSSDEIEPFIPTTP